MINRSNRDALRQKLLFAASISLFWFLPLGTAQAPSADPRQALQRAIDLVQQQRLEEAEQKLKPALSDPKTHAVACSVLGTIRLQQKRLPESAPLLQEAIRIEPKLIGAHLTLATVYILQEKPELAQQVYRRVLELDRTNATARLELARFEAEKGNYEKSLAVAHPALAALKQSPDGLYLLAADYLKTGDRSAAAVLVKDWGRLQGVPVDWSIRFAVLLAKEGMASEAVDLLEGVKQSGATSYELAFNLAGMYLLRSDLPRALENYDLALNQNPQSAPALMQAGTVAEQNGELERSLSYWIRAKKIEPENPEILLGFGRVCLKMDLLEDAEPALAKAVTLQPENPTYQYTLASVKVGKKQFEAAQSIFDNLVEKKPQDSQLQYALGSVLYLEGHLAEAAMHLRESIRLQPDQLAPYYYLGLVIRDQGNEPEAIQILAELLQRHPDHAPACEALGSLLMSSHRYPEAESNLEKAVRLNPKSVKANYQLGLLLTRMGKKEEADKRLEIAKSLRQEDETNSHLQLRLVDPDHEQ